jgi:hypothetical protein
MIEFLLVDKKASEEIEEKKGGTDHRDRDRGDRLV